MAGSRGSQTFQHTIPAVLAVPLVVVALALVTGTAHADASCVGCSGTYSGEWKATYETQHQPPEGFESKYTKGQIALTWTATLSWQGGEDVWTLRQANGTFSISGAPSPSEDCTATLSPGPDAVVHGEAFWIGTSPGKGLASAAPSEYTTVIAEPPVGWGGAPGSNPLASSSASGPCAAQSSPPYGLNGPWRSHLGSAVSGPPCHYEAATGKNWIAFPVGGSHTESEWCGTPASEDRELGVRWFGVEYKATITLDAPGSTPPGGSTPPAGSGMKEQAGANYRKVKEDARMDFAAHAAPEAMRYCLRDGRGLFAHGAGASISGSPAIASVVATSLAPPFCHAALTRLGSDLRTFRDPPLRSIEVLAVPRPARASPATPCGRHRGRLARYCEALSSAWIKLDTAAAKVAADATAIEATISRESAALEGGNQAAVGAQDAHLGMLLTDVNADRGAEHAAGATVAAVLRSDHLLFRLDRRQSGKIIAAAVKEAGADGVARSDISSLAPRALKAARSDLRAGLGRL
jgi:hypothetical protein